MSHLSEKVWRSGITGPASLFGDNQLQMNRVHPFIYFLKITYLLIFAALRNTWDLSFPDQGLNPRPMH